MTRRSIRVFLFSTALLSGCHCASEDIAEPGAAASSGSSGESSTTSFESSGSSTGAPFDASRWLGRYHFESVFLPFGERGDPHGPPSLTNFEILPDFTATMLFDHCAFDAPIVIAYAWSPSDDEGWLSLFPGKGEASLRYMALDDVETLRVQLIEPCRELKFEVDGQPAGGFSIVRPGASCWVDRCTVPNIMQVDYCEGEEPPSCS